MDKAEKTVEKKPEVVTRRLSTKISENFPKQMKQQGVIVSSEVSTSSHYAAATTILMTRMTLIRLVRGFVPS